MARKIDRLRTLLFSVAVGGALMFGTHTALAAAPSARTCPDFSEGRCTNQFGCQLRCDSRYPGAGLTGLCENGCCFCLE
ncbi:MAG TPA: hypothetical protein VHG93_26970 [Longimicrobium sp.]|nr:hypothetical protein [Longimicrobium sp.]